VELAATVTWSLREGVMLRAVSLALGLAVAVVIVAAAQRQPGLVSPGISAVDPPAPARSASAQTLTISGSNFAAGLSLEVLAPGGEKVAYSGAAIQNRRETAFQVAVVLAAPGGYTLTVVNADGSKSEPFVLKSRPAGAAPTIERVLPEQLTKDPQPQVLTVMGSRFVAGLTVSLTDPIGTVFLLKGAAIGPVTASSFTVSVAFEMVGDYALLVTNPSGESSNNVTLKVTQRADRR
jgi:hypothetical protein